MPLGDSRTVPVSPGDSRTVPVSPPRATRCSSTELPQSPRYSKASSTRHPLHALDRNPNLTVIVIAAGVSF